MIQPEARGLKIVLVLVYTSTAGVYMPALAPPAAPRVRVAAVWQPRCRRDEKTGAWVNAGRERKQQRIMLEQRAHNTTGIAVKNCVLEPKQDH